MSEPDETFGQWVDRKATQLDLNDYELHTAVGLYGPARKVFHQKSATRLRHGGQVNLNPYLVARLIELLAESEEEAERAWELSGVLPPGATREDIHEMLGKIARRRRRSDRQISDQGGADLRPASFGAPSALKRSCAPHARRAA
jgi:hypothetical protein